MCRIGGHFDASSAAVFSDNPMPDFPTGLWQQRFKRAKGECLLHGFSSQLRGWTNSKTTPGIAHWIKAEASQLVHQTRRHTKFRRVFTKVRTSSLKMLLVYLMIICWWRKSILLVVVMSRFIAHPCSVHKSLVTC
jgi:hypothetical protein